MPSDKGLCQASVAARIAIALSDRAQAVRVADVRIGLGYTAVELQGGHAGLAFTFRDQAPGCCSVFKAIRPLAGRPAADLLALLTSSDAIEAGVGLACANALANQDKAAWPSGDILDHLVIGPDDHVAMVGHFGPLVEPIVRRARSLTVFERVQQPSGLLRPQEEAETALPGCQIALITATSIINHTVDGLLAAASHCREVVLLGASTPLLPALFGELRVTLLSGVVVRQADEVLRVVSEGGGMRQFSPFVRKVTVRVGSREPQRGGHDG